MKLSSLNQKYEINLELNMCGYADDDEWLKEVRVSGDIKSHHNNAKYDFLAYLRKGNEDEITEFIKGLHHLYESRQGKIDLQLDGMEQEDYDKRSILLSFYSSDNLGHIALSLSVSGSTCYSDTSEFPFSTSISFEVDPSLVEEVAYTIEALYEGVGQHA